MSKKLLKELWGQFELKCNHSIFAQIGPLDIWITREPNEWKAGWIYNRRNETRLSLNKRPVIKNQKIDWKRWVAGEAYNKMRLKPVFPDRSVIVRPELPVSLLPQEEAMFFVGVPCFISICFGEKEQSVCEIPTCVLSNTWSGENTVSGELCYGLKTTAKRDFKGLLDHPHRIICPIQIKNESQEILNFEHLCLPVRYLNTYLGENRLWGNLEKIEFMGKKKWGRIVSETAGPAFEKADILLSHSREKSRKGILFHAFNELVPFNNLSG